MVICSLCLYSSASMSFTLLEFYLYAFSLLLVEDLSRPFYMKHPYLSAQTNSDISCENSEIQRTVLCSFAAWMASHSVTWFASLYTWEILQASWCGSYSKHPKDWLVGSIWFKALGEPTIYFEGIRTLCSVFLFDEETTLQKRIMKSSLKKHFSKIMVYVDLHAILSVWEVVPHGISGDLIYVYWVWWLQDIFM